MPLEQVVTQTDDFAVVRCNETILAPIGETWKRIGGFSDAGRFLNVSSPLTAGDGGLGSVRVVNDHIVEIMVGQSEYSYTYMQTVGPMASFGYHGCVDLRSDGPMRCYLTYTILYNQATMDEPQRLERSEGFRKRFGAATHAMKLAAELED